MMTEKEMEVMNRVNEVLGRPSGYMNLIDIIEALLEVIEDSKLRRHKRLFTKEQEEIAKQNGISYRTLYMRVHQYKWSVERAMTEPVHEEKKKSGNWDAYQGTKEKAYEKA
jgi:hypothetical protein